MALDFPATAGQPTDGTFTYEATTPLGVTTYAWGGVYWYSVGGSAKNLGDLDDVVLTDAEEQDILVYNGAAWLNEPDLNGGDY